MLTEIEAAAVAKSAKVAKDLPVGTHNVDILVRIQGTITKGEDYTGTVYAAVPFDKLFAVAMSKLNGTTVAALMREALAEESDALLEQIKPQAQAAIAALVGTTEKIQSGKTTAKLTATKVNAPALATAAA